jgi:uncharacterized protein (TIGR02597 family)
MHLLPKLIGFPSRGLFGRVLAGGALAFAPLSMRAQSVTTTPVGVMTVTVSAAPSSTTPRYTSLALPLLNSPVYSGRLAAVTASGITVAQSVVETMNAANPYFIRINTGANQGLTLLIKSNNGSVLTVDNLRTGPLTSLPVPLNVGSSGDTYSIYPADTLNSLFGNLTQGGTTPSQADQIWLWQPAASGYFKYYYNVANSRWQDTDFDDPANNIVIMPDAGVMYVRRATTPVSFVITGTVPACDAVTQIRNSGYTLLASGFPVPMTLGNLGLSGNANWGKSSAFSTADQLWIWQPSAGYSKYFYNSSTSRWEDSDFGDSADSLVINPQTPMMIKRFSTGSTSYTSYSVNKPYSL